MTFCVLHRWTDVKITIAILDGKKRIKCSKTAFSYQTWTHIEWHFFDPGFQRVEKVWVPNKYKKKSWLHVASNSNTKPKTVKRDKNKA